MQLFEVAAQDGDLAGLAGTRPGRSASTSATAVSLLREDGQPGDVADAAVAEVAEDGELLPAGRGVAATRAPGSDLDAACSVGSVGGSSCRPSASQARMVWAGTLLGGEALAAFVRHAAQAPSGGSGWRRGRGGRCGGRARRGSAGDSRRRVVAAQAELEAVLAAGRAVAGARRCSRRRSGRR